MLENIRLVNLTDFYKPWSVEVSVGVELLRKVSERFHSDFEDLLEEEEDFDEAKKTCMATTRILMGSVRDVPEVLDLAKHYFDTEQSRYDRLLQKVTFGPRPGAGGCCIILAAWFYLLVLIVVNLSWQLGVMVYEWQWYKKLPLGIIRFGMAKDMHYGTEFARYDNRESQYQIETRFGSLPCTTHFAPSTANYMCNSFQGERHHKRGNL